MRLSTWRRSTSFLVSRMWDFLRMRSGTTTRPTTAGSALTTAKLSTFLERPTGGCLLATLTFRMLKPHWRPCFKSIEDNPSDFEPHSRRCQAECWGSLYSHVHSVLDKREDDDKVLYLVRWKACWTPENQIVDQDWIPASLEANKNRNCRRSTRLGSSFEDRKEKYKKMMVVVNLEWEEGM